MVGMAAGCGSGSTSGGGTSSSSVADNVLTITVNGSLCSNTNPSYPNKACVAVTVCSPGTANCQTINDILVDTGSSGLRIFKQVLDVPLTQVASGSGSLAECIQYADGSADWGPVQTAKVILGNEPPVQIPIQVIDATFGNVPAACGTPDQSPSDAGYNGILGVGLFVHDCGTLCTNNPNNGFYYTCIGSNCTGTTVTLSHQVQNPVALLPQDNNGVIIKLPGVPEGGSHSVNGTLVLGIGTQPNNVPSRVIMYAANQYGEFTTTLNGTTYNGSFIDSSSNGLFSPSPSATLLPDCPSPYSGWFCPSSNQSFSATNTGALGSPSGQVSFEIGNARALFNSANNVFAELGGSFPGEFDWGLPFHFGRNVHVGMEGMESSLGTGPYWAY